MNIDDFSASGRILFSNEACMVINKRPGESPEFPDTEAAGIPAESPVLFPVHRIDIPVSGCLLFARTREAAASLSAAFAGQHPRVEKRYWAVVETPSEAGAFPDENEKELLNWIYEDKKKNKSFALPWSETPPSPGKRRGVRSPKRALLRYRLAGRGDRYLFLEIELVTGRHHQIRAQLAAAGLRIKGDLKYGAKRSEKGGGIRLHAASLAFPNPLKQKETIRARALPPLMDPLWTAFAAAVDITTNETPVNTTPPEER